MTNENRQAFIAAQVKKGDKALRAAHTLMASNLYDDAVTRMYYAAFHYATAALGSLDIQIRNHRGLQALFSLHLVKTGKVSFQMSKDLRRLQSYRESADYDAEFCFNEEGAKEELEVTARFIFGMREFLGLPG